MQSFLTPIEEVFAFLEDSMMVAVGYAMAADQYGRLSVLLNVSVVGGLLCGLVAFITMIVVSHTYESERALLNPSHGPNAALRRTCPLVPSTDQLLDGGAVHYWLLVAASWIPSFMMKGITGFHLGTYQVAVYLAPWIVQLVVPLALWFALINRTDLYEPASSLTPSSGSPRLSWRRRW